MQVSSASEVSIIAMCLALIETICSRLGVWNVMSTGWCGCEVTDSTVRCNLTTRQITLRRFLAPLENAAGPPNRPSEVARANAGLRQVRHRVPHLRVLALS